jgi:hypothetical protein
MTSLPEFAKHRRREKPKSTRSAVARHSGRKDVVVPLETLKGVGALPPPGAEVVTLRTLVQYHPLWLALLVIVTISSIISGYWGPHGWVGLLLSVLLAALSFGLGFKAVTVLSDRHSSTSR